jgi:hypothetical protein
MSGQDVESTQCEALFASPLQRWESPTPTQIEQAIMLAVSELGAGGCALRVAQEFGDHPDTAVARMQWARNLLAAAMDAGTAMQSPGAPSRHGPASAESLGNHPEVGDESGVRAVTVVGA